jgi:hypothetical protein
LDAWTDFAVAVTGASAALLGLLIVGAVFGLWLGVLARPSARSSEQPLDAWFVGAAVPATVVTLATLAAGVLLVVVDDLHWADTDSRAALLAAVRRLAGDRVLVLVTSRPGASGAVRRPGWSRPSGRSAAPWASP